MNVIDKKYIESLTAPVGDRWRLQREGGGVCR